MISKSYLFKVKRYQGDVLVQLIRNLCLTTLPSYRPIGIIYEGTSITSNTFEMKTGFGVELQTLNYMSITEPDYDQPAKKRIVVNNEVKVNDLKDDGNSSDSVYAIDSEEDRILLRTLSTNEALTIVFRYGEGLFTASENREYINEKLGNPSGLTTFSSNHTPIVGIKHTVQQEGIDDELVTIYLTVNNEEPDKIMEECFKKVELFLSGVHGQLAQ